MNTKQIMGHNKNQRKWDAERTRARVHRMDIAFEQWSELVMRHFVVTDQTTALRDFHNEIRFLQRYATSRGADSDHLLQVAPW